MTIAPLLLQQYPDINQAQRDIVGHVDGPLLVIAGPGSGKTFSLVMRTMNLLLQGKAKPRELVVCTFTEKAAYELRDRIALAAAKVGYLGDLSELRVSTIHALCNQLVNQFRHRTPLGNSFETLDDLTQLLFIFDHFQEIVGPEVNGLFLGRYSTKWTCIQAMRDFFDKITEELVDVDRLGTDSQQFLQLVAGAYRAYERALFANNRLDFAHQQKLVYDLLLKPDVADAIVSTIKYVMVDEYQDTNYIQEQLLLRLAGPNCNLCVVGDEDQSLYRFRGATVRNILEFAQRVPKCKVVKLTTNYRSHPNIIAAYDAWMASADWSNPAGTPFRYDKTIEPDPKATYPEYPAVFAIWGKNKDDEAKRFAELVSFLKEHDVVADYSQIALLLHSVREDNSRPFMDALAAKGIKSFCPRARRHFDNEEVRLLVACLSLIFGYYGDGRGKLSGYLVELAAYVDDCITEMGRRFAPPHPLSMAVRQYASLVSSLKPRQSLDMRPADFFYRLIAVEPFVTFLQNENRARNLAILSQLLNTFQNYYHYTVVTYANREYLRYHLFNSFLRLLHEGGINDYEDPDRPFPLEHVQIMTIHQAKGLEFPVVVVGSLSKRTSTRKQIDRLLQPYYHRPPFEPEKRVTDFDRMRLHYVAFSRAEKVLVLTAHEAPEDHFAPIWQGLPQWPYVQKELLAAQSFKLKERMPVKRSFSFTGDLKVYETCPRQYQFFREYDFTPSRSAVIFFGLLVHQTIEEIHRRILDGESTRLNEARIRQLFDRTFQFLCLSDVRPIGPAAREDAFRQVMNYFDQNQDEMKRVIETEVDVSIEKDDYILTGKVDLLMGADGKLELLDFKTSPKPVDSPELLTAYERQLCTYAHILEKRHGKRVDRMLLYWTSEPLKSDALMLFPNRPEMVDEAGRHFDSVVKRIQAKDFRVVSRPESRICKECDLKTYCGVGVD